MGLQWASDFQKMFPEGLMPGNACRIRLFRVFGSGMLMFTGVFGGKKGFFKSIVFPYFPLGLKNSKSTASDGVPVRVRSPAPPPSPCFTWGLAVFLWKSEAVFVASAVASLTSGTLLPEFLKSRKPCPAWGSGFSEVPEVIFRIGERTSLIPRPEECPGWPGRSSPWSCS